MLSKLPHLFDEATRVTTGDSRWQGRTSPDYFAFVGPFGGCTAATILRALIEHPQRAGVKFITSGVIEFCLMAIILSATTSSLRGEKRRRSNP